MYTCRQYGPSFPTVGTLINRFRELRRHDPGSKRWRQEHSSSQDGLVTKVNSPDEVACVSSFSLDTFNKHTNDSTNPNVQQLRKPFKNYTFNTISNINIKYIRNVKPTNYPLVQTSESHHSSKDSQHSSKGY